MKHIKKKFQFQRVISNDDVKRFEPVTIGMTTHSASHVKIPKDHQAYLLYSSNTVVKAFYVNLLDKKFFMPEPDPILVYFNTCYVNFKNIEVVKKKLFDVLDNNLTESLANDLYEYFGLTTGFVIFLFTAIEGFINRQIPEEFHFTMKKTKKYRNLQ